MPDPPMPAIDGDGRHHRRSTVAPERSPISPAHPVAGRGGASSHGHRFPFGGSAHRIIGLAACPVLVVKR